MPELSSWVISAETRPNRPCSPSPRIQTQQTQRTFRSPIVLISPSMNLWRFPRSLRPIITLNNGTSVPGTVTYAGASNTAAFIPSAALLYNNQYVLQVVSCVTSSCITDTAGNSLASDYTFTFTTESAPTTTSNAPSVVTAVSGNGQVTLDWRASNGATSYSVYYGTSPGSYDNSHAALC